MHNQINPALATSTTLHIDSRNGVISECKEINRLSGLGVRDDPNLEAIPHGRIYGGPENVLSLRAADATLPAFAIVFEQ